MLLWREILIRIMELQRNTLIERKNRTLKCLKRQYSTVRSVENVAVLMEDGICPLFFVPTQGDLTAQESPPPGIYHPRPKWWGGGGGGGGGATGVFFCEFWTWPRGFTLT